MLLTLRPKHISTRACMVLIRAAIPVLLSGQYVQSEVNASSVPRLPDYTVTTNRTFLTEDEVPLARKWTPDEVQTFSPQTVDELLMQEPSFSLYRRQSAFYANPTSQGVSLRYLGATAATRTLVLRDGVPQNDPFGGWITWSRYTPAAVESLSILPGSQATSWGNQSAGGTLLIQTLDPFSETHQASFTLGSGLRYAADTQQSFSAGNHGFSLNLHRKDLDGFYLNHRSDRGSIDQLAEHENLGGDFRYAYALNENTRVEASFSCYEEDRNNGTPLANNSTEAYDFSVRALGQGAFEWDTVLYYQYRNFENQFTAVNDARDSENPVLDQFDIASEGVGGSASIAWDGAREQRFIAGADLRHNNGETNEDFSFGLDDRRVAGGDQTVVGVFLKATNRIGENFSYEATVRGDHWSQSNGRLREIALVDDTVTKEQEYPDRNDWEPSASISGDYRISDQLALTLGAGYSFRIPTINELYRPYRVGSDITDANADLQNEHFFSLESALRWMPREELEVVSGVYHYWIGDAIANVYQFAGPGPSPGGFVPGGGSYNQRQNVDDASVFGWQSRVRYRPFEQTTLELNYLFTRTRFDQSSTQPALEGKRFPQVPEHKASFRIHQQINQDINVWASLDYNSSQYDDALNTIGLRSFAVVRAGIEFPLSPYARVSLRVDNLTDETIITGRSFSGVRSVAPPRSFWITTQLAW